MPAKLVEKVSTILIILVSLTFMKGTALIVLETEEPLWSGAWVQLNKGL